MKTWLYTLRAVTNCKLVAEQNFCGRQGFLWASGAKYLMMSGNVGGYRFIAEVAVTERPKPANPVAVVLGNNLTDRPPEPALARTRLHTRPRLLAFCVIATIDLMIWAGIVSQTLREFW